ncbi:MULTISPECIES: hypothetical protein [Enterococcus]|uniref:Uncharacterized protein n=1 Tax=Enterococcus sulfureus ATCC 49903 TaxID=1140003 RepID=S0NRW1_9ENTE|nr:hypothetical protein [Enterococcus sulfureus]EOT47540.1 hypothetical protein OMY_00914 [Enterococcus sulfureus ATCC 49903]EOT84039.1 hypothetical protein I573_01764 [Enterococcus sulfureus ATCC 49903]
MHSIYVEIVTQTILEKYSSEEEFVLHTLGLTDGKWRLWKEGMTNLSPELNQKIVNLFSDYEWMVVQKVLRQSVIYPEKRTVAMEDYRKMKLKIAQEWLQHGLGTVELLPQDLQQNGQQWLNLKVTISYGEWGFDDVLSFRVPAVLQKAITREPQALIEWMNERLEEI